MNDGNIRSYEHITFTWWRYNAEWNRKTLKTEFLTRNPNLLHGAPPGFDQTVSIRGAKAARIIWWNINKNGYIHQGQTNLLVHRFSDEWKR